MDILKERILVIDGATGTALQELDLTAEDFGGEDLYGCNENLILTRPEVIRSVHRRYLEAGADCIETNTFGATPLVLDEYSLGHLALEINEVGAKLAREEADALSTPDRPRWVLGSIGPTTKTLSVTGGISFDELVDNFRIQALGLLRGGVDILLLETVQDGLNLKAAQIGIEKAGNELGYHRPVAISCTIEPMGTMLAGQTIEAFYASIEHFEPIFIGMNCATGPQFMTDHLRSLSNISAFPVSIYPNAGLPNADGEYEETPEILAANMKPFFDQGWINVAGGCCGTTVDHIAAIAELASASKPRTIKANDFLTLSGIESVEVTEDTTPLIVGERTNVIGSRKFKKLIAKNEFEKAAEIGRKQDRGGAHIIDVCMADPDREELEDMLAFLPMLTRMTKAPLMIDSTDSQVLEEALKLCQGKSVINSINLEDGEERFESVVPLARRYGAAIVVGCIDEDPDDGMAVTVERKLEIAERSFQLLTEKYGVPAQDIIFDPLVFPVGTGDQKYTSSASATIDGVRAIQERFPQCGTVLGISNVSFGLPPAGREVLNSVFLYHCVQAGLSMAIVNSERMERYASIPESERQLCENLIWQRTADPIAEFTEFYRGKKVSAEGQSPLLELPIPERLARNIIEGTKEGIEDALAIALETHDSPLAIINGPLMKGMAEVGRLFNDNELIVAEVLQSAEAMKAAVAFLEPHMEKSDASSRGKVLLATVKGDVHDIGKNLVQIILSNNGFEVVDLGIKVPPTQLIDAVNEHQPDAIGLSGLLVKSAQQMVVTAEDLQSNGIDLPILVGGAALSEKFTATRIQKVTESTVIYAKDAMDGLRIVNELLDDEKREEFIASVQRDQERITSATSSKAKTAVAEITIPDRSPEISILETAPPIPDTELHFETKIDPREIYPLINPQMLYGRHMGLRGNFTKKLAEGDSKALELKELMDQLLEEVTRRDLLLPRAMWRHFPASSTSKLIRIHCPETGRTLEEIPIPRQQKSPFQSLCDYVLPAAENGDPRDHVAIMVTTAGSGVRNQSRAWMNEGEYLKSHAIQALAVELAEGLAERIHRKIRASWGFPDPADLAPLDLFRARYRGKRYSFGYPACPDLSCQESIWRLLQPQEHLGVELTEGFMMDPEASVSALAFHHPDANYFGVGGREV
ncbi:methionine synthase [bacterium TMED181]|nr:methionine synthase [Planctomycetota bacterium]OUW44528.1 MAG: methionine synthase [bacterium TMED181]